MFEPPLRTEPPRVNVCTHTQDREDLDTALELGADWIALSFVQKPDDIRELRRLVRGRARVIAKVRARWSQHVVI